MSNKQNLEELTGQEYRSKGYRILMPRQIGFPDLIAIPEDIAGRIVIRTVKGLGDGPSKAEKNVIAQMVVDGLDAKFIYSSDSNSDSKRKGRRSPEYWESLKKTWFDLGYVAFQDNKPSSDYPKPDGHYNADYYRSRDAWRVGWKQAENDWREANEASFPKKIVLLGDKANESV